MQENQTNRESHTESGIISDEVEMSGAQGPPWGLVVIVIGVIATLVLAVLNHAKDKPDSPQALVAHVLRQAGAMQEWQPGMGPQPLISKPAAFHSLNWKPLYFCPTHGSVNTVSVNSSGQVSCPLCKQSLMVSK